ncbi:MAG: hypothetical protein LBV19_01070 [Streptococcaceae bacterium]|jgi:hypothetical protein|nr:hypothetical protein [Streptococcaceae bacterium]
MKKVFKTKKSIIITAFACLLIVLSAFLLDRFVMDKASDIDPAYAKVEVSVGNASVTPLRSDSDFVEAMKKYPIVEDSISGGILPIPGIYSVYGLQKKVKDKVYDLVKSKNFTPQGMTLGGGEQIPEGRIFISAYDHAHKLNSVIFELDYAGNYIKTISLNNKAHVGGLGYDLETNTLWLGDKHSGQAVLSGLSQTDIDAYDIRRNKPIDYTYRLYIDTIKAASTIDFFHNNLWVGYFTQNSAKAQIQAFNVDFDKQNENELVLKVGNTEKTYYSGKSNEWHVSANYAFSVPKKVQGVAVNAKYLFLTRSFGNSNSKISRYNIKWNKDKPSLSEIGKTVTLPPYLEEVAITDVRAKSETADQLKTFIYPLFESSQSNYRKKTKAYVDRIFGISQTTFNKYAKTDKSVPKLKAIPVKPVIRKSK